MKHILLFLLLLAPAPALADLTFDISCENVEKIHITCINESRIIFRSFPGPFHVVYFGLKPSTTEEFSKLVKASRSIFIHRNGIDSDREMLIITTNGKPLRSDEPKVDAHAGGEVGIVIIREEDAFAAARSVCPQLVPSEMVTYGQ